MQQSEIAIAHGFIPAFIRPGCHRLTDPAPLDVGNVVNSVCIMRAHPYMLSVLCHEWRLQYSLLVNDSTKENSAGWALQLKGGS